MARTVPSCLSTSAILSVSEATQTRVRFSTGHGERDPENYAADGLARLSGLLERDNYDVEKLPSLGPSILEECDVLVAAGPTRRFADHELELLSEYLRKGGKLLVLLEPQAGTASSSRTRTCSGPAGTPRPSTPSSPPSTRSPRA